MVVIEHHPWRIHGTNGIFTYMKTIKNNEIHVGKYTIVPWIFWGVFKGKTRQNLGPPQLNFKLLVSYNMNKKLPQGSTQKKGRSCPTGFSGTMNQSLASWKDHPENFHTNPREPWKNKTRPYYPQRN